MSVSRHQSPAEQLATPVQFIKGVGPQRAELLERLGLKTAADLLFFFPRDYQDLSEVRQIAQLEEGEPTSVVGVVEEVDLRGLQAGRSMLGVLVRQGNDYLRAVWFNQPHMRSRFDVGRRVLVAGTPKLQGLRWEMHHPRVEQLGDSETVASGRILPIYPLTEGLKQNQIRLIVERVVDGYANLLEEVFPDDFLDDHRLWPIHAALPQVHRPENRDSLEQARHRFIYQELLVLQLALSLRRAHLDRSCRSPALPATSRIDARIRRLYPFELTADQQEAIEVIGRDMGRETPMNRLLQGEVGSGKTVVAEYAMLLTVAHGWQAAIMAPTEVLAQQHVRTLQRDLHQSRVRIGLLTGALPASQRKKLLTAIGEGEIDLVVGTQALLNEHLQFARLGLVVIDEQHRFGVRQRAALRSAGLNPHYLVMTATPIPRTVSMTVFGDLDVSTLRQLPPNRQRVHTYWAEEAKRDSWWEFFRRKLGEGRQGYVIAPLVEGSEENDVAAVTRLFEVLKKDQLAGLRLGLVHGRMSSAEKEAAMGAFRRHETDVLVATSVVEVGVDVPNATLMTIQGGERFGLAQLHQLRGRVSRGVHPGFVCVFAEARTDDARRRLTAFQRSGDGFELAELDFQLRGPGDLFSTRQHGLPPLRIANLIRDQQLLEQARRDAHRLIQSDPELADPAFSRLRKMVLRRYGHSLDLGDVG